MWAYVSLCKADLLHNDVETLKWPLGCLWADLLYNLNRITETVPSNVSQPESTDYVVYVEYRGWITAR